MSMRACFLEFTVLSDSAIRMPFSGAWCKVWIYFGFVFAWTKGARPRFDTSTDMGLVLVPADAEVDSVIFRLRATDQDADFPLVFEITATITPVVRIDNLPCTLYNKVCQANVILTKRLVPGRLHDFAVRVRDTNGDTNSMQATISVTNATTPRDKIFPHIPSLVMVPEDTKPGKELDYLLVRANSWSGKPVYIELWQPKELFKIRQRQTPTQTRGVITLIGELDFETQSVYTLTIYATDPYTEPGKDTRNIAGLNVVVIVTDVQDVPPIFTLAPPLTRINNSVQPGDIVLRVHAEDGDKGVPREVVYGLVSEGNPFTPFFNISETSGEITLARPLEELTQITHVGAPVVLTVVAEELRRSRDEPPAQATVVDVGFLLGEPGNTPPYFESDNYVATIDENLDPGTVINFGDQYTTRVKDEDIGKAGVFALKLENNNGTFEINPTVAERTADFIVIVRDNALIDYELYKALTFKIVAQEVGPATNLSASVPVTILLRDVNDNPPVFDQKMYEVTLSENVTVGSRVIQVHATDTDTGFYGDVRYTGITGEGSKAFVLDPESGLITVATGSSLDREIAARLDLSVEARDENGTGNVGTVPLIVNLLDVNDNPPIFDRGVYEFMLNADLTNFTSPAFIKAVDSDAEPPNNIVRYEIIHGNYENKFYLNETSGELIVRSPITKIRRKKQSAYDTFVKKDGKSLVKNSRPRTILTEDVEHVSTEKSQNETVVDKAVAMEMKMGRQKRDQENALYTLTARAYDLGIPHLSSETEIRVISGTAMEARIMMFVVPGEQPNSTKTVETLATITGGRVTVLETRPYVQQNNTGSTTVPGGGKKSIIVACVEQTEPGTPLVDVEKIRETLAANGVGIINGTDTITTVNIPEPITPVSANTHGNNGQTTLVNNTVTNVHNEEVTVYKAENKLLFWLLIILGLLMLLAIIILITCCICPGCPFYMAPRKRRVHSSETVVVRSDGRPKRHFHRQPAAATEVSWNGRKQAWSADPTRRNWQFNKRNVKNCSLPGDVAFISGPPNDVHMNHEAHRLGDAASYDHSRKIRLDEQDRMYMEEMEGPKQRGYDMPEMDSLQRHEIERESDTQRQGYRQRSGPRYMEAPMGDEAVREQHFYREGNAEVLRLVTRGEIEDSSASRHHHRHHCPTTLIVDGKDIILQRFIEDQKVRPDLSMQDMEAARMMESHQRSKDMYQQQPAEIILIPDRLELGHRQHIEEIGPTVQRLVIDHGEYESQKTEKGSQIGESLRQEKQEGLSTEAMAAERPSATKEQAGKQYSLTDLELARQKALLARILLRRDNRHLDGGLLDSASYLETQSLPGQVAIATQTDRTAATQTDRHVRSRSDNDESDEDSRHRKKLKSRKKYGDGDWKRARTLWMKSPIDEKSSPCYDKRLSILQRKTREVKEDRKISLEPDVLREISDSLNGNGSSYKAEEDKSRYRKSEQATVSYKILNETENDSSSSMELRKKKKEQATGEKSCEDLSDDQKMTESLSSPDIKAKRDKRQEKSPKKETKSQSAKKSEGSMKPSFRILEKEFTMLTKKFSKLGEKKFQESTGSDSTSQEKSEPKKEPSQKTSQKKADVAGAPRQASETTSKPDQKAKQKKETAIAKTKQKLRYQQSNVMSTGSSEFDELFEKNKKQGKPRQDTVKQKQPVGAQKARRQVHGRQELKKQVAETKDDDARMKDTGKVEKPGKSVVRGPKLAVSRKDRGVEESSTSDQMDARRDKLNVSSLEKKSSVDSSGTELKGTSKSIVEKTIQRFSDDFVEQTKVDSMKQQSTCMEKEETKTLGEKDSSPKKRVLMKNGAVAAKQSAEKWIRKEEEMMKTMMEEAESLETQRSTKMSTVSDQTKEKLKEAAVDAVDKLELIEMTESPRKRTRRREETKRMTEEARRLEDQESMKMPAVADVSEAKEKLKEAVIAAEMVEKGMLLLGEGGSVERERSPERGTKEEEETKRTTEEAKSFEGQDSTKTPIDIREAKEKLKVAAVAADIIEKGMAPVDAESLEKPSEREQDRLTDVANIAEVSSKDKAEDEPASDRSESKGIIIPVVTDTPKREHESKDEPSEGTNLPIDHSIVTKREDETVDQKSVEKKRDVEEVLEDVGKTGLEGKKDVEDVSPKTMEVERDEKLVLETEEYPEEEHEEVGERKAGTEEAVEAPAVCKTEESGEASETQSKVELVDDERSVKDDVSPLHDVKEIEKELMGPEDVEKHRKDSLGENGGRKDAVDAEEDPEVKGDEEQVVGEEKEEVPKIGGDDQPKEMVLDQGKISEDEKRSDEGQERHVESQFPERETKMDEEEAKVDEKEDTKVEAEAKMDGKAAESAQMGDDHVIGKEIILPTKEDTPDKEKEPLGPSKPEDSSARYKDGESEVPKKSDDEEKEPVTQPTIEDDEIKKKEDEESILLDKERGIGPSQGQTIEKESAFLEKPAASDGKEEAASEMVRIDEQKVSEKEQIPPDEVKETYLKAEKTGDEHEDAADARDSAPGSIPSEEPEIDEKDKPSEPQAVVDDRSSEKDEDMAGVSKTEDQKVLSEEKSDPKDPDEQDEAAASGPPDDKNSKKEEDDSSRSHAEEQSVGEDSTPVERPVEAEEPVEDETRLEPQRTQELGDQASKMESAFLGVAEAVHLSDSRPSSVELVDHEAKSVADKSPVHSDSITVEEKDRTPSESKIGDHAEVAEVPSTSAGGIDKPFHSDVLKSFKQAEEDQKELEKRKEKEGADELHEDRNKDEASMDDVEKDLTTDSTTVGDPDLGKPGEIGVTVEKPVHLIGDEVASPEEEKPEEQRPGDEIEKEIPEEQRPGDKVEKEKQEGPGVKVDEPTPEDQRPGDEMETRSPETKKPQVTEPEELPEEVDKELLKPSEPSERKVEHERLSSASSSESQITEVHASPEETGKEKSASEAPTEPDEQLEEHFTDRSFIVVDESFEPFLDQERKEATAEEAAEEGGKIDDEGEMEDRGTYIGDEEYTDVSVPLFTEIMQQSDDLEDSDSSSDISRKTTLTTRPYQTPRHRSRQSSEREAVQSTEIGDPRTLEDEEDTYLTIELVRDDDLKPVAPTEAAKDEDTKDTATSLSTQITAKLVDRLKKEAGEAGQRERSMSEVDEESSSSARRARDKASPDKQIETVPVVKPAKVDTPKLERKMKGAEKRRLPVQRKKKSSSEESSEEKALHSREQTLHARHRPRRKFDTDQLKHARPRQTKKDEEQHQKQPAPRPRERKGSTSGEKHGAPSREIDTSKTQPKYMAWYKKNREEMERRRAELRASDDESQLPRWLRRSMRSQKTSKEDKKKEQTAGTSSKGKRKVKPLVNVESEQLKAIVRQGRKLRKAEGGKDEDPPVQIFATSPPAATASEPKHHLVQHSEYKYEKIPAPFYLHPPPAPHPSPQLSPQHFEAEPSLEHGHVEEDFESGIAIPLQGGARLRHQQLLEKKSVFDIAYSEAAPSQLRADSTTPPS
ncbi:uncharacterized protein LOC143360517 [Halictus rubicundus]|uniref:uncharacterized protein LOC143360517 n=1 Tax=Halictus rubicundus TaxID=77578 RepID=UPI0040364961